MIANLKSEDIDATLKHGQVFASKKWSKLFVTMYVLLGIVFAMVVFMLIGIPLTVGEYDNDSIITIVCCGCGSLLLLLLFILVQRHFASGKKKVDTWLLDAVLLKAYAVSKGEQLLFRGVMVRAAVVIEVKFVFNNKQYIKQSTCRDKPLCLPVYKKYANKEISIAYSPQYDEVMLIKPQSLSRIEKQ